MPIRDYTGANPDANNENAEIKKLKEEINDLRKGIRIAAELLDILVKNSDLNLNYHEWDKLNMKVFDLQSILGSEDEDR